MMCILMDHYYTHIMVHIYSYKYISSIFQFNNSEYQKDIKCFSPPLNTFAFFYYRQLNSIAGYILSVSLEKSSNFNSIIIKQELRISTWITESSYPHTDN